MISRKDKKPKLKWNRPKLIVLTRGKREERLFLSCKDGSTGAVLYRQWLLGHYGVPTVPDVPRLQLFLINHCSLGLLAIGIIAKVVGIYR